MESENGKSQREAVNVVFRLLDALISGDVLLIGELLVRLRQLDQAKVYFDFGLLIESFLEEGISEDSLDRLNAQLEGTPFASFLLELMASKRDGDSNKI